eukprot:10154-Alexandrium_andersonii.AAC.1
MSSCRTVSRVASRRTCFVQSSASIVLGRSPHVPLVALASLSEKRRGASLQPVPGFSQRRTSVAGPKS